MLKAEYYINRLYGNNYENRTWRKLYFIHSAICDIQCCQTYSSNTCYICYIYTYYNYAITLVVNFSEFQEIIMNFDAFMLNRISLANR